GDGIGHLVGMRLVGFLEYPHEHPLSCSQHHHKEEYGENNRGENTRTIAFSCDKCCEYPEHHDANHVVDYRGTDHQEPDIGFELPQVYERADRDPNGSDRERNANEEGMDRVEP